VGTADELAGSGDASVFGALADPTRLGLLELLIHARRASATTLAAGLPVTRQAVIKHLHVLEAAGLVSRLRSGREVLYMARVGPLEASARWLTDLAAARPLARGQIGAETSRNPRTIRRLDA
jgi:DNA-binding transcriptional ArsR family regulator